MNKIFDIYLAKTDVPGSEAYARLDLPALPWTLLDVLDKLRLRDGEEMYLEIDNYYDFGFLAPYFEDKPCSLYGKQYYQIIYDGLFDEDNVPYIP